MNKYYTPSVEDLYIGYECEKYEPANTGTDYLGHYYESWDPFIIRDAWKIVDATRKDAVIRTKYLSREDIESLGWALVREELKTYSHWCNFESKDWELSVQLDEKYFPRLLNLNARGHSSHKGNVKIACKSINELRKIMQFLAIK